MQFSERWLRDLVDPALDTGALAHLLTMSGLEVESCEPVGRPFSGVVVGAVRSVAPHPNADRLKVCEVDAGAGRRLQIVCGAPNVAVGMKAPLACVGARVPGADGTQVEIRAATMRGVESQGMLCSSRDLGLSQDHSGLLALEPDAPVGADLREALALDDHIFLIKLTPNRADCLSVLGVAREVAALTGATLNPPRVVAVPAACDARFPVRISDPDGCGRFTGRVLRNVNAAAPTPHWMRQRLERAGQRSISALVDVTNYVMLELGRPLHVYDLDKLAGGIDVRWGRSGERVKLLNEQTVALEPDVLAITDRSGPIGVAGIMGGDSTKADLDTRHVLLEAAFFHPDAIAGRARRYNFASDASHRFERGVDFDNNVAGIERATRLILDICGGEAGPVDDVVARLPRRAPVRMRVERARKVIGLPLAAEEMSGIFTRLALPWREEGTGAERAFVVDPPSYRFDLQIEEDLIEEVARVHGFERIPARPPSAPAVMRSRPEAQRSLHTLRQRLAARDYQEVLTFSFVEPAWEADFAGNAQPIRLLNPIASQLSVMRSSLIGGLIEKVRYNLNRQLDRVRVFEVGRVFVRAPGAPEGAVDVAGVHQPMHIAAVAYGAASEAQWGVPRRAVDFFDVKGDVESLIWPQRPRFEPAAHPALHPGKSARVLLDGHPAGWIGELHPRWLQRYELPEAVVLFELEAAPLQAAALPVYRSVSRFPAVTRDLSFVVDSALPVQAILDDLQALDLPALQAVNVFDLYHGAGMEKGKKSLAFRVLLQDTQGTLTDAAVDDAMQQVRRRLEQKFGAQVRGEPAARNQG
jgi:phenylalanyl-tRNA synthetase beta chain